MNRAEIEKRCKGRETRTMVAELRAASDEFAIMGTAARHGVMSHDLGGFRELISKGAFTRSLKSNPNVVALFNHNANQIPLGRTTAGTLKLSEDDRGLYYHVKLDPNNPDHKALHSSVKRGDTNENSFAFTVAKGGQRWEEGTDPDSGEKCLIRTLTDVDLLDISPVCYGAYPMPADAVIARHRPDYGTNAASDARAVIMLRKAAKAMGVKTRTAPYPSPYDYDSLAEHCSLASSHAESAYACSEFVGDSFDDWDDNDSDRSAKSEHKTARAAHKAAHDALNEACNLMAAASMAITRCMK